MQARLDKMVLSDPVIITARLLAGVRVGDATLSIHYGGMTHDGRRKYRYYIDRPDKPEFTADDIASGVGGGTLQEGLRSLLSFLGACGSAVNWNEQGGGWRDSENSDLFPPEIAEWAAENSDDLSILSAYLDECENLIVESK